MFPISVKHTAHPLKSETSIYRRRWFLPVVFILTAAGLYALLIIFKEKPPAFETRARIWPVKVMKVSLQTHVPVLTVYGTVENPGAVKISASGASYVTQLPVSEGQVVNSGDLLVELDQRDFLPKVHSAAAAVSRVKAQIQNLKLRHATDSTVFKNENRVLELNQQELSRAKILKQRGLGPQVAVEQAEQVLQNQKLVVAQRQLALHEYPQKIKELHAQLTQAESDLEVAQLQFERSRIVSRSTAIVGRLDVAVGDRVEQNQLLFSVYPFKSMQVRAKIPSSYLPAVQSVLMGDSEKTSSLSARVVDDPVELVLTRLAGEADSRGIDALLVASSKAEHLRQGMALTVYLDLPAQANSVVIPYEALYGADRAYKVVDGKLKAITVTRLGDVPMQDGIMWALVKSEGLSEDDLLLTTHMPNAVNGLAVDPQVK